MKKIISFLIIAQFFICCWNEKGNSIIEKDNSVTGNWSFIIANGYNCYTCPKIEFGSNGKGNLILSSTKKIEFDYKLLPDNKIQFDFNKDEVQSFFKQSDVFYYENQTVDNDEYFDLLDIKDREIIHSLIRNVSN